MAQKTEETIRQRVLKCLEVSFSATGATHAELYTALTGKRSKKEDQHVHRALADLRKKGEVELRTQGSRNGKWFSVSSRPGASPRA